MIVSFLMTTAEEYRECAAQCLRLAQQGLANQTDWQGLAERWTGLAARAEEWRPSRLGPIGIPPPTVPFKARPVEDPDDIF